MTYSMSEEYLIKKLYLLIKKSVVQSKELIKLKIQ